MKHWFWVLGLIAMSVFSKKAQAQLIINEIYASPASGDHEWVEIYNPTAHSISLVNWQLGEITKDGPGNFELVDPSADLYLLAHGYLTFTPTGKLSFNNGGDTLYLVDPTGLIVDEVTYPKLTAKQAYARTRDGTDSWEITTPTPSDANDVEAKLVVSTEASLSAVLSREASSASYVATGAGKSLASATNASASASDTQTATKNIAEQTNTANKTNSSVGTSITSNKATGATTNQTTSETASPSPVPSPTAKIDPDTWKDGIEFATPRIDYHKTSTSATATPQPQVLGVSTQADSITQEYASPQFNWTVTVLAIAGIIVGVAVIGLTLGAEWLVSGGTQDENEDDLSVF